MTPPKPSVDPRIAHTRSVVLEATAELLAEEGFGGLTIEGIAERSGVARSTIYRNWPDRTELLRGGFDQLCAFSDIPDLGSMEAELRLVASELAQGLNSAEWANALPSLIGAAHHDDGLAEAQRKFSDDRRAITGAIFVRAAERGEIKAGREPEQLAEMFAAGFFFRFLMTRGQLDDEFIDAHVQAIITLASA